eukprot:bmy_14272T0
MGTQPGPARCSHRYPTCASLGTTTDQVPVSGFGMYPAGFLSDDPLIIIDDNSDTWIVQCAPEKKLPIELQDSYEKGLWTEFMGRVFKYLGDEGVREDEMKRAMISMPLTPGVVELLNFIRKYKDKFDRIIISDSNSVFIDWVFRSYQFS